MRARRRIEMLVVNLLLITFAQIFGFAAQRDDAVTLEEVNAIFRLRLGGPNGLGGTLTGTKVYSEALAEIVRHYGIDFRVSPATAKQLRKSGASRSLLQTLQSLGPQKLDIGKGVDPSGVIQSTLEAQPSISEPSELITVPAGTWVSVAPILAASSQTVKKGEILSLALTQPITVEGVTLIAKGAVTQGEVVYVGASHDELSNDRVTLVSIRDIEAANGTTLHVHGIAQWSNTSQSWSTPGDHCDSGDGICGTISLAAALGALPVVLIHNAISKDRSVLYCGTPSGIQFSRPNTLRVPLPSTVP